MIEEVGCLNLKKEKYPVSRIPISHDNIRFLTYAEEIFNLNLDIRKCIL